MSPIQSSKSTKSSKDLNNLLRVKVLNVEMPYFSAKTYRLVCPRKIGVWFSFAHLVQSGSTIQNEGSSDASLARLWVLRIMAQWCVLNYICHRPIRITIQNSQLRPVDANSPANFPAIYAILPLSRETLLSHTLQLL